MAQPNYSQLWQKHIIITSIKTMQQYLQYARTLAITKHTKITIAPIKNHFWSSGIVIKDNQQILKTSHFYQNIKMSWHGFGMQDQICIYPNGLTYNNGHFIFNYKNNAAIYTLFISKFLKTHIEHN